MRRFFAAAWLLAQSTLLLAQSPEQKLRFKRAYDVLEKHCFACHGEEKQKGDLRMDSLEAMLKGGENETPILVQGHADQSDLITRMRLPISDDDVMPPAKKDRPSEQELVTLVEWINDGALWIPEVIGKGGAVLSPEEIAAMHKDMGAEIGKVSEDDAVFFKQHIEPLFRNHCAGCHGDQKQKAGLRLDNRKAAFTGSDNGKVIVPGKPEQSEVFIRLSHPVSHEDVMPPKSKSRVPAEDIQHMKEWIARGAPWPLPKSKLERGGENHYVKFHQQLSEKQVKTLNALKDDGLFVEPLIWESGGVRVLLPHTTLPLNDALFSKLSGLEEQVQWLDLSKRTLTPATFSFINRLPNLRVLHLERSTIDDAKLRKLPELPKLEYINLHSTEVSDVGLAKLRRYKNLRKVFLWNSKVTDAGVKQLQNALPNAEITYTL